MSDKRKQFDPTNPKGTELTFSFRGRDYSAELVLKGSLTILLLGAPFLLGDYLTNVFTRALIFGIFAISLDIIWGYGGILTFGHAAIFGLGAYIMAKILSAGLFSGAGYLGIILATLIPALFGLILAGALFYRGLGENTFVIITLAVAAIAKQIAISWQSVTGGFNGLIGLPPLKIGVPFVIMVPLEGLPFYYVTLGLIVLTYLFSRQLISSSFGSVLIAIRENEQKARALGHNLAKYKTLAFALSSALAGFAGAIHTAHINLVSPNLIGFVLSTQVILWVLIGGRGTLVGPIIGAVFLILFESIASGIFQFGWTLLVGIALILIVLVFPGGIMQALSLAQDKLSKRSNTTDT